MSSMSTSDRGDGANAGESNRSCSQAKSQTPARAVESQDGSTASSAVPSISKDIGKHDDLDLDSPSKRLDKHIAEMHEVESA